jgi:hypothetical protein
VGGGTFFREIIFCDAGLNWYSQTSSLAKAKVSRSNSKRRGGVADAEIMLGQALGFG